MVPMRRSDRAMEEGQAYQLLRECLWVTLSTVNCRTESPLGLGSPYAVPISVVESRGCFYFHCATEGHKVDNLKSDGRVCITCVGQAVSDEAALSVVYESATFFAEATEVLDKLEKKRALAALCQRFAPSNMVGIANQIDTLLDSTAVWKLTMLGCSGKQRKFE